ncbi:hypothetical protein B0T17DRAFT_505703 [Bombardia bombarda]|uniref:Uncharacterized protein n=1 Tax=Bombardia bombarda TaxID=252184 RepID=A0AA40C8H4_9PEZI|nr:hypothetical protein B0T17DRAFT_505703 [Bombardia bombarda]
MKQQQPAAAALLLYVGNPTERADLTALSTTFDLSIHKVNVRKPGIRSYCVDSSAERRCPPPPPFAAPEAHHLLPSRSSSRQVFVRVLANSYVRTYGPLGSDPTPSATAATTTTYIARVMSCGLLGVSYPILSSSILRACRPALAGGPIVKIANAVYLRIHCTSDAALGEIRVGSDVGEVRRRQRKGPPKFVLVTVDGIPLNPIVYHGCSSRYNCRPAKSPGGGVKGKSRHLIVAPRARVSQLGGKKTKYAPMATPREASSKPPGSTMELLLSAQLTISTKVETRRSAALSFLSLGTLLVSLDIILWCYKAADVVKVRRLPNRERLLRALASNARRPKLGVG